MGRLSHHPPHCSVLTPLAALLATLHFQAPKPCFFSTHPFNAVISDCPPNTHPSNSRGPFYTKFLSSPHSRIFKQK